MATGVSSFKMLNDNLAGREDVNEGGDGPPMVGAPIG